MAEASDNRRMVRARGPHGPTFIGDLPEEILLHIMSFLTTREAVHTCLLSHYWRYLWRSVPCINVSIQEFQGEEKENGFDSLMAFKAFVSRLLMLRNPVPLDELRLTYCVNELGPNCSDYYEANYLITYALHHNARAVQVVNRYNPLELFPVVFASSWLNRLDISSATLVPGFFKQLQIGCPGLEFLRLYDCIIGDLQIFSSTLKVLILSTKVYFSFDNGAQASISAPSLNSLCIEDGLSGARLPILNNMPSLKTASVSLCGDIITLDADGLRQFLGGLCDVTSLDFSYSDRKLTMEKNYRWCPKFSKLINLTLDCSFLNEDFYGLIVFLQNSPNLKRLTLKVARVMHQFRAKEEDTSIAGELDGRSFICEQLNIVEILCWGPSEMRDRVEQFWLDCGISPRINDRRKV